jgi:ZIP family zinc transporter
VESAAVPQQVGGVAILDITGLDEPLRREDLAALVATRLLPRGKFGHRVDLPGGLAAPRWQVAAAVDLCWHVAETALPAPTDTALQAFVAAVIEAPLPRDRPLWRCWLAHGLGPDRAAVVVVMHHVLGDGTAVVAHRRHLLSPPPRASDAGPPVGSGSVPGRWHAGITRLWHAAAVVIGLIQLATDRSVPGLPRGTVTAQRQYVTLDVPLAVIRATARCQAVRVTDLILAAVAGALAEPAGATRGRAWPGNRLRVAVTLLLGPAGAKAARDNRTAAIMVDLPTTPMSAAEALHGLQAGGLGAVGTGLAAGALAFFALDSMIDRLAEGRAANTIVDAGTSISLALGAVLDGIPENLVLGVGLVREGGVSWALLVAIFVQNFPEGMGSAIGLHDAGARPWRICAGWAGVAVVTALAAPVGFGLADILPDDFSGAFNGFAAGALLVMLVDSMAPEARRKGGRSAGLATTVGFALGVALSGLS